ncbi:SMP-30/gluconolactonase/LRE family protein [Candidatus Microgenomates bacterium]|nr:SMP-30/gluconolactonase/LRE family protein [Candidatus Microgenomates bacterium]
MNRAKIAVLAILLVVASATVSVAEMINLSFEKGWQTVSFGFYWQGSDLFDLLSQNQIQVFSFDKSLGYSEKVVSASSLKAGRPYWLFAKSAATFSIDGNKILPSDTFITALAGWNLLPNPFWSEADLTCRSKLSGVPFDSSAYVFTGEEYVATTTIPIGASFFFKVAQNTNLEIFTTSIYECGDGIFTAACEACDDGANNGQIGFCNLSCAGMVLATCNGIAVDEGEICDGNQQICSDGCYSGLEDCLVDCSGWEECVVTGQSCGDGVKTGCEFCDDGANNGQMGFCSLDCGSILPSLCGNGDLDNGEYCDSDTIVCNDGCYIGSQTCLLDCSAYETCDVGSQSCGDGIKNGCETCDDGANNGQPEFCNLSCNGQTSALCGNGTLDIGEICEVGAFKSCRDEATNCYDGSRYCKTDCTGYESVCDIGGQRCDNGIQEGCETCDDGAANGTPNHCNAICHGTTSSVCDNGVVEFGEDCDPPDTNTDCPYGEMSCFVCGVNCQDVFGIPHYCSDGTLDLSSGEQCDDDNTLNGDGCSADCQVEVPPYATQTFVLKWGITGSGNGQFSTPRDLDTDTNGNVYVVDQDNDRVQKFDADGNWLASFGPAIVGTIDLWTPEGVCVSPNSGTIAITDRDNSRVVLLDYFGNYLREFGGSGDSDGEFYEPRGCVWDKDDNIYVADSSPQVGDSLHHRVQKFDIQGQFLNVKWGQKGSVDGQFSGPIGIIIDQWGYVYVADSGNHRVQKFDADGTFVAKWGSPLTMSWPTYLDIDANNRLYVVDFGYAEVDVFETDGQQVGKVGVNGSADGEFNNPIGVAVSGTTVYVSDMTSTRNNVQKFQ